MPTSAEDLIVMLSRGRDSPYHTSDQIIIIT